VIFESDSLKPKSRFLVSCALNLANCVWLAACILKMSLLITPNCFQASCAARLDATEMLLSVDSGSLTVGKLKLIFGESDRRRFSMDRRIASRCSGVSSGSSLSGSSGAHPQPRLQATGHVRQKSPPPEGEDGASHRQSRARDEESGRDMPSCVFLGDMTPAGRRSVAEGPAVVAVAGMLVSTRHRKVIRNERHTLRDLPIQ
jgi:hypothetical protein